MWRPLAGWRAGTRTGSSTSAGGSAGGGKMPRTSLRRPFLHALQAIATFQGRSRFYTWLYRIAVNLAISHRRKRARAVRLSLHGSDGEFIGDQAASLVGRVSAEPQDPAGRLSAPRNRTPPGTGPGTTRRRSSGDRRSARYRRPRLSADRRGARAADRNGPIAPAPRPNGIEEVSQGRLKAMLANVNNSSPCSRLTSTAS